MPARRKAHRPRESEKDREFEKLLRAASRLQGSPRTLPRIKTPRSEPNKPIK
jgi:hypothetical protein